MFIKCYYITSDTQKYIIIKDFFLHVSKADYIIIECIK